MAVSKSPTNLECLFRQGRFPPHISFEMFVESLQGTVSFFACNGLAENVLLHGMCVLGHMKRRYPYRWPETEPMLDFR